MTIVYVHRRILHKTQNQSIIHRSVDLILEVFDGMLLIEINIPLFIFLTK